MKLGLARDFLYVNWALPLAAAPALPANLSYEVHRAADGRQMIFVSALLFRFSGPQLLSTPVMRLSYPQMHLRTYVLDEGRRQAVLFLHWLVPPWVLPASRLLSRRPAKAAEFDYPSSIQQQDKHGWSWRIRRLAGLEIRGRLSVPSAPRPPRVGSWSETVTYFSQRSRGYVLHQGGLRKIRAARSPVEVWPLAIEVREFGLLADILPGPAPELWSEPHSAWLCPDMPSVFELDLSLRSVLPRSPTPVAESC